MVRGNELLRGHAVGLLVLTERINDVIVLVPGGLWDGTAQLVYRDGRDRQWGNSLCDEVDEVGFLDVGREVGILAHGEDATRCNGKRSHDTTAVAQRGGENQIRIANISGGYLAWLVLHNGIETEFPGNLSLPFGNLAAADGPGSGAGDREVFGIERILQEILREWGSADISRANSHDLEWLHEYAPCGESDDGKTK